jgi:hypothetical protein
MCALREWRCYLEGAPFTLFTDHQPLTFTNTKVGMSRRQVRWVQEFQRYTFEWRYKKGTENSVADALSRVPALLNNIVFMAVTTRKGATKSVTWADQQPQQPTQRPAKRAKSQDPTSPTRKTILDQIRQAYKLDTKLNKPRSHKYTQKQGLLWKNNLICGTCRTGATHHTHARST